MIANASQLSFTWLGADSDDPLPYSTYEFFVGAFNSMGGVNSTYSMDITTPIFSKFRYLGRKGLKG
jgi:hypothetical protein